MPATSHKLLANPQAAEIITILVVSQHDADHAALLTVFSHRNWRIERARAYGEALRKLREAKAAVVICERDLPDGTWKDVLYELALMDNPPQLIVMSCSADDQLWAEVLNLGGCDVLQKPLEPSEVRRAVAMAWRQLKGASAPLRCRFRRSTRTSRKHFRSPIQQISSLTPDGFVACAIGLTNARRGMNEPRDQESRVLCRASTNSK